MSKLLKIKEVVSKMRETETEATNTIKLGKWNDERRDYFQRERGKLNDKLRELGLELQCTDYGEYYCLDLIGLEAVLKAIEE